MSTAREHVHDHGHDHGHGHSHDHSHGHGEVGPRQIAEMAIATLLLVVGMVYRSQLHEMWSSAAEYAVFLLAYLLVGRSVVWSAVQSALRGFVFDENFLMTLATLGAIAIHELPEAAAVMLFFSVGEYSQDLAVGRSRRSIQSLLEIRSDYANIRRNGDVVRTDPREVSVGDRIVVKPGEKIPLDGTVKEGRSYVDTSALTGESVQRKADPGDTVLAGMVNSSGLLEVEVTKTFGESSASKILKLVENAAARKAPTEAFITTFSRYYTTGVVVVALLIALLPPLVAGASLTLWTYRALVILVISCPCALVLSIPLGYFGGIGGASRKGILVKGANYLDALTRVDAVGMDKTGTLTKGVFQVTEVTPYNGFQESAVLELAAHAESHSSHPIGAAILEAHGQKVDQTRVTDYEEIAGHGVKATIDGKTVLAGNDRLLHREHIPHDTCDAEGTLVFVASAGELVGKIIISDEIKPEAIEAVQDLHAVGVGRVVMLTGDDKQVARKVAQELGIDEVHAELLPENKVEILERIIASKENPDSGRGVRGTVLFAGDGINDAPVLARADIGVAMGGLGSDAAIETADVVIMNDSPAKIPLAIRTAKRTRSIVLQNIAFALTVKLGLIALGAFGLATIWEAVFADVGVAVLAVLNATRALKT